MKGVGVREGKPLPGAHGSRSGRFAKNAMSGAPHGGGRFNEIKNTGTGP